MEETPNQRQARLRRERREAKLKEQGTSRLEKITQVSGRQNLPPDPLPSPPSAQIQNDVTAFGDGTPDGGAPVQEANRPSQPTEDGIRALLREPAPQTQAQDGQSPPMDQDPLTNLLSSMMGEGGSGRSDGSPPDLASMMGLGAQDGGTNSIPVQQSGESRRHAWWKVVHAILAFSLGIYAVVVSTISTPSLVRVPGAKYHHVAQAGTGFNLFWAFATMEFILQSTRHVLERKSGGNEMHGLLGTLILSLPPPWQGYVRLAARYSGIFSTIAKDAGAVIFVVGITTWWQGLQNF